MFHRILVVVSISAIASVWYANMAEAQFVEEGLVSWWSLDRGTIDGVLEKVAAADKRLPLATGAEVRLGRSSQQSSSADWYTGCIDEVRLYDRALSDAEIQQNYEKGTAVFPAGKLGVTWARVKASTEQ